MYTGEFEGGFRHGTGVMLYVTCDPAAAVAYRLPNVDACDCVCAQVQEQGEVYGTVRYGHVQRAGGAELRGWQHVRAIPFLRFPALQYAPVPLAAAPHAAAPTATVAAGSAVCGTATANSLKKTAWVSTP